MKAVIQKVKRATLFSEGEKYSEIKSGILILLGVNENDNSTTASKMADKLLKLRIFDDENDKTNWDIFQAKGEIMLVSNFTLYGSFKGCNRPDFFTAARPEVAEPLYMEVFNKLKSQVHTVSGAFRTYMEIEMVADGPSTYIVEID
jgi:D-tyrosyl-tRNA(Tyr) deacylase